MCRWRMGGCSGFFFPGSAGVSPASSRDFYHQLAGETPALPGKSAL